MSDSEDDRQEGEDYSGEFVEEEEEDNEEPTTQPTFGGDDVVEMNDVADRQTENTNAMEDVTTNNEPKKQNLTNISAKIDILDGPDISVATFIFHNESHTMGNSVRHQLMKNKKVSFCGYTVPHPLEAKMQLRLQCNEGENAHETLDEGLIDLMNVTEHVMHVFEKKLADHTRSKR